MSSGNPFFRTKDYRRNQANLNAIKQGNALAAETNRLLMQMAQKPPILASDGRYYSADGQYVWDGTAWQARS